ncbi:MAG: o-succinylbenzoate--CoA ligase [Actinobacteria bacterium]|nr:o-succinylbenzoate--CoA ligase [Actinomycetota bacterium]
MYFTATSILAQKFADLGIKENEKIAILGNNSEEYVKLLILILNSGAIAVPVSPFFPISKIHNALERINCSKIIIEEKYDDYKDVQNIKSIPLSYFVDDLKNIDLRKLILRSNITEINKNVDRDASIILTSGSTNEPKAVLHTIENHYFNALGSNGNITLNKSDCWLLSLPVSHISGFSIIFKALTSKINISIKQKNLTLFESLNNQKVTHLSLIPFQLAELIENFRTIKILKNLKAILVGGAPVPQRLIEESISLELPVYVSYGSTEMASQITCTLRNDTLEHLKTSGKVLKYRELKIDDSGEILVKGKTLFKGYLEKDALSGKETLIKPFDKEGWFKTGDVGSFSEDGYLNVYGRKDFMFIYKGENIFPEEIENALKELREINDALVVPVSKGRKGQIPAAFLKSNDYQNLDIGSIKKSLSYKIESFKIPEIFLKWPEKEAYFKPDRKKFKKIAEQKIKIY